MTEGKTYLLFDKRLQKFLARFYRVADETLSRFGGEYNVRLGHLENTLNEFEQLLYDMGWEDAHGKYCCSDPWLYEEFPAYKKMDSREEKKIMPANTKWEMIEPAMSDPKMWIILVIGSLIFIAISARKTK